MIILNRLMMMMMSLMTMLVPTGRGSCPLNLRFNLLLHIDLNHDLLLDNMGGKTKSCACTKEAEGSPTQKKRVNLGIAQKGGSKRLPKFLWQFFSEYKLLLSHLIFINSTNIYLDFHQNIISESSLT